MSARYPVEGFTVERTDDGPWPFVIRWPNGVELDPCNAPMLELRGIPLPPEPRTGRLGLNEADTREMAGRSMWAFVGDLWGRSYNAAVAMCREDVAEWDAQPEPDTLTVTLPTDIVRGRATFDLGTRIGDACHAALDAAGLA